MHGLRAGLPAGRDDAIGDRDRIGRRRRSDRDGLVRHLDMQRVAIGLGIDRDGGDAEAPRRLDDAAGDFAAIGDQDLGEHAPAISRGQHASLRKTPALVHWALLGSAGDTRQGPGDGAHQAMRTMAALATGSKLAPASTNRSKRALGLADLAVAMDPAGQPGRAGIVDRGPNGPRRRQRRARSRWLPRHAPARPFRSDGWRWRE